MTHLESKSKVYKPDKRYNSLIILIPARLARDSSFTIKAGDKVILTWNPEDQILGIMKQEEKD